MGEKDSVRVRLKQHTRWCFRYVLSIYMPVAQYSVNSTADGSTVLLTLLTSGGEESADRQTTRGGSFLLRLSGWSLVGSTLIFLFIFLCLFLQGGDLLLFFTKMINIHLIIAT